VNVAGSELRLQDASKVAERVRLREVHIAAIEGRLLAPDDLNGQLGWSLEQINIAWVVADGELRVVVPVTVQIHRTPNGGAARALAKVHVTIRADYVRDREKHCTDAELASFVGMSSVMHVWPYVRAEIQSLSAKIGLPPLVLPPILSGHTKQLVTSVTKLANVDVAAPQAKELPPVSPKRSSRRTTSAKKK